MIGAHNKVISAHNKVIGAHNKVIGAHNKVLYPMRGRSITMTLTPEISDANISNGTLLCHSGNTSWICGLFLKMTSKSGFQKCRKKHTKHNKQDINNLEKFCMEDWSKIPLNVFSNIITNYRKRILAVTFAVAQSIKPVPIIVKPVFWGNIFFYLKKLRHWLIPLNL